MEISAHEQSATLSWGRVKVCKLADTRMKTTVDTSAILISRFKLSLIAAVSSSERKTNIQHKFFHYHFHECLPSIWTFVFKLFFQEQIIKSPWMGWQHFESLKATEIDSIAARLWEILTNRVQSSPCKTTFLIEVWSTILNNWTRIIWINGVSKIKVTSWGRA